MTIMNENSTVGLFESTSEGLSVKRNYASPTIKIVAFQVEAGFTDSNYKIGKLNATTADDRGTQDFNHTQAWYVDGSGSVFSGE